MATTENITVLFTDLVGSTELASSLTPEAGDEVRRKHFSALRQAIATMGGTEVKNLGDGLMVVFPAASTGLACAVAMQQAVHRDNGAGADRPLSLRIGLSAGEATNEDGDYFGDPVVEAARLCARADGGQILAADLVRAMTGRRSPLAFTSLGGLELKGLPDPIETLEVSWEPLTEEEATSFYGVPLPARLARRPGVGVVGREEELASLAATAKMVASGEGRQVVLIAGEPGQGKTTLVAEIARRAHEDGMTVLLGRCDEDVGSPYRPFHEALTHYVAHAEEAVLRTHVGAHGGELARLVPALRQRLGELPPPQTTDPDTERYLLYGAVVGLLDQAANGAPVLLVLDDLHWADKPSLQLLRHAVANTSPARLLILATFRDAELSVSHPLAEALGGLLREQGVSSLHLKGFEDTGVIAFMEASAGHGLDDAGVGLAHQVYRETDGNPFFVAEVLRNLAESGAIYQDDHGRWTTDGANEPLRLPDSLRQVIGARVARTGETALRVLTIAAVIGRDFDLDLLAGVTEIDEDAILDVLDTAAAADLVRELPGTPGRYAFAHALIQHTVYEDIGLTRRSRLHRRVAEALEDLCGARTAGRAAELARHFILATRPTDVKKSVGYAKQAADEAMVALAPEDAVRHFEQALELLDHMSEPTSDLRLEILVGLGTAQRHAGIPAFRDTLLTAANEARAVGATPVLVAAALANNRGIAPAVNDIDYPKVEVLEAALEAMPERDSPERAVLLGTLCNELAYGPLKVRTELAEQSMALARRLEDPATLVRVTKLVSGARRLPWTLAERLADSVEALDLARHLGDPSQLFLAAQGRRNNAIENAEFGVATECLAIMQEVCERLQQPIVVWETITHEAIEALLHGDPDGAEALSTRALELGQQIGEPGAHFSSFGLQFMAARLQQGRLGDLLAEVKGVAERNPGMPSYLAGLALAYVEAGDVAEARALLEAAAADGFRSLPMDISWIDGVAVFAQVAVELGVTEPASRLFELLSPYSTQIVFETLMPMEPVAWYLGGLCHLLGELDQADTYYRRATELNLIGARTYSLALTQLAWGRLLLARGGTGDRVQATALLEEAHRVATARGYGSIGRRAGEALASLR